MAAKRRSRRKAVPRAQITIRIGVEILEMLKKAAVYHKVGHLTYIQWVIENGLKAEAKYYGWAMPGKKFVVRGGVPTERQEQTLQRLMRVAQRKAKKAGV